MCIRDSGIPYEEHRKSLQINVFDNYAVYGIKDQETEQPVRIDAPERTEQQLLGDAHSGGAKAWQNR